MRRQRRPPHVISNEHFILHKYLDRNGCFDYESYRRIQEAVNKRKLGEVWVIPENIAFLAEFILGCIPKPTFGLYHGTRRGKEQDWFRESLHCELIWTEISDSATLFPHTIQWDFHEAKPEWNGSLDFIYSNSLDHGFDPKACLATWMSCLKSEGLCILEHSTYHSALGRANSTLSVLQSRSCHS